MILKYIIYLSVTCYYQVCSAEYDNKLNKQAETFKDNLNFNIVPILFSNDSDRPHDRDYVVFGSNIIVNENDTAYVHNRYRLSDVKSDRYQILKEYLNSPVDQNDAVEPLGVKDRSLRSDAILQYLIKARTLVKENIIKNYDKLESLNNSDFNYFNPTNCEEILNQTLCDTCDFADIYKNTSEYINELFNSSVPNITSLRTYHDRLSCIEFLLSISSTTSGLPGPDNGRLQSQESKYSVSLSVGQWIRVSAYVAIFVLGVVGNSLVVATLLYHRNMRTITNIFLLNLAVSDLLLGVFCMPFTLVGSLLRDFIFGEAMCKLVPYMQAVSISVSVWTLVAISLERYYAICKPLTSRQWQTMRHASQVVALVWVASIILMIPIAILSELVTFKDDKGFIRHKCRESWPNKISDRTFNILLSSFLLLVPLIIMGVAYMKVVRCLSRGISMEKRQVLAFPDHAKVVCNNGSDSSKLSVRFKKFPKNRVFSSDAENDIESSESSVSVREGGMVKSKSGELGSTEIILNDGEDKAKYIAEILSTVEEDQTREENPKEQSRYSSSLQVLKNSFKKRKHKREGSEASFVERNSGTSDDRSQEAEDKEPAPSESRFKGSWRRKTNSSESSHYALRPIRSTHLRQSLVAKQRVIRMLFVLVAEFFICWTPLFLVNSLYLWIPHQIYGYLGNVGISLIQLLAYASSCCNPITYCFMNATFFQSFKQAFSFKDRRASGLQRSFLDRGGFQSSLRENPNFEISILPPNKPSNNISRKMAINANR